MVGKDSKIGGQRVLSSIHILRNPFLECICHLLSLISRLLDISMSLYTCIECVIITKVPEARQTNYLSDELPGNYSNSSIYFKHDVQVYNKTQIVFLLASVYLWLQR